MSVSKNVSKGLDVNKKDLLADKQFYNPNLNTNYSSLLLGSNASKDVLAIGQFYGSNVQMEDYPLSPKNTPSKDFALLPAYSDFSDLDDSFNTFSDVKSTLAKYSNTLLGTSFGSVIPKSYISVFNHFRSDYEDFSLQRNQLYSLSALNTNLLLAPST